jgi:LmbE family N-acetylglucosaminyl deacetylase
MNIVLIGAHPDDCEVKAGGAAALWCEAGHTVHIVSMTNGDAGHQTLSGPPLAKIRKRESARSAAVIGAKSVVMNHHDGELQPTLAVRKKVVSLIRKAKADLVITHRPNDYHPDHRYTSQVVQDAAYMVTVPAFVPSVPSLRTNPVFMYMMDRFQKPYPFKPDVAVDVTKAMPAKWAMLDCMDSQVYEWLAWQAGRLAEIPKDSAKRIAWLKKTWSPHFKAYTNAAKPGLVKWYGKTKAANIGFSESFEVSEYGHQPLTKELKALFPMLPKSKRG